MYRHPRWLPPNELVPKGTRYQVPFGTDKSNMNIRLDIEYDGCNFHGWQKQPSLDTIQGTMENVLGKVMGRKTNVYGAGRTDSGVHAEGQVAHFFSDSSIRPEQWRVVLNTQLPPTIRVTQSQEVDDEFHSQTSAVSKVYEYRVLNRNHSSALDRRVLFYWQKINWDAIRTVLPAFIGKKDFAAFQGQGASVKTTVRTIHSFDLIEDKVGKEFFRDPRRVQD